MLLREMGQKSPVRIFEKSIHGGLGKGNIGAFMARAGVGKTACLVYLALDEMVRGNKVLHFGVEKSVNKIRAWYNEIANHLVEFFHLTDIAELHELIEKNLIIMSYVNHSFTPDKMKAGIQNAVNQGKFMPQMVIVDGFDFENATREEVEILKKIAQEFNLEVWFAARIHRENAIFKGHIPAPYDQFEDQLSVIVLLEPIQDAIFMKLLKDHNNPDLANLHLKLDPKSLLIKHRYT